jgi:hypothetical protein
MIRTAQPTRSARNRTDAESQRPAQRERELMGAVLTTTIDDLLDRRPAPEAEARRQTARAWIPGAAALMMSRRSARRSTWTPPPSATPRLDAARGPPERRSAVTYQSLW